jgi:hypothetical protein
MALDFAVLIEDETAADIVSLEWRQPRLSAIPD